MKTLIAIGGLWCLICASAHRAPDAQFPSTLPTTRGADPQKCKQFRDHVKQIVVIYQENWSFDGLYPNYPGADSIDPKSSALQQISRTGKPYTQLPAVGMDGLVDSRFPVGMPVAPFDCSKILGDVGKTGDLVHRFYQEQWQINRDETGLAKMNKYVAICDASALTMGYFDASKLAEGKLADEFTICDHFFHSAFGGSFLNHIFLITAQPVQWPGWATLPPDLKKKLAAVPDPAAFKDGQTNPEGFLINTAYSAQAPHPKDMPEAQLLAPFTTPTIGDRLSDKSISWKWYSGGWNHAVKGKPDEDFQFHHQPFAYFAPYVEGSPGRKEHLRDELELFDDVAAGALPQVSFVKFIGRDNEHPQYATVKEGQERVGSLVEMIRRSPLWDSTMIIIAYDENGGRWDHVPPPQRDQWGPGTRVPAIVVSPFAKRHHVEKTTYDTLSILRLIETRFELQPLSERENCFGDMLETMEFK